MTERSHTRSRNADHRDGEGRISRSHARRERKAHEGPCPIMRSCGGCEWIGVPYRKQLKRKLTAIEELFGSLLDRFGDGIRVEEIRGMEDRAPRAFRYKANTPFAPLPAGGIACGFYARGTHRIVPVDSCAVEAEGARRILNGVARAAEQLRIPAYDEDARQGVLRYAQLRLGWGTDEGMLTVVTATRAVPRLEEFTQRLSSIDARLTCIAQNINGRAGNAILGSETRILAGAPVMHDRLLGCTFAISPTAFYQTNPAQTEVLYRLAIEGMALEEGDILLDAYCGSGTIGLCAAADARERRRPIKLIGVERNPRGISDAWENARLNGMVGGDEVDFVAEDATAHIRRLVAEGGHVDVICLDPPRAGSTEAFLKAAVALHPRRIVYVSCNPATQARDLEILCPGGYGISRLAPVDMFPHTPHIESVAVLTAR